MSSDKSTYNSIAALSHDKLRELATNTLYNGLVAIRQSTNYRGESAQPVTAETAAIIGELTDALHNVPDWLAGNDHFAQHIPDYLDRGIHAINELAKPKHRSRARAMLATRLRSAFLLLAPRY